MEAVTQLSRSAVPGHVEQMHIDQAVHQLFGPPLRHVEHGRGRPGSEIADLEQSEEPEGALSCRV